MREWPFRIDTLASRAERLAQDIDDNRLKPSPGEEIALGLLGIVDLIAGELNNCTWDTHTCNAIASIIRNAGWAVVDLDDGPESD